MHFWAGGPVGNHEKSCILMKIQENSSKINRFRKDGWLGQVKSPKILFFKQYFLENLENLRKSSRLLLGPAPASSGELGPARPNSGPPKIDFWGGIFFLLGWMVSESLISDVFEFPSVFNFPQAVEGFECRGCKDTAGRAHCEQ